MATTNEGFDAAGLRFRMNLIIFIENSTLAEKNQDSISRICNAKSTPILSYELCPNSYNKNWIGDIE